MKHVIKTLASRRLIPQRKVFNNITTGLFVSVVRLWNAHLQEGVAQLSGGDGGAVRKLEMGLVCLKSECTVKPRISNPRTSKCSDYPNSMLFSVNFILASHIQTCISHICVPQGLRV